MLLTRRRLFLTCGAAGAAALLPAAPATATAQPDDWLAWFRANRQHVAVALDDGRGGRVSHRAHERQPLASAVKVVHLAAYAKAVETGVVRPDEKVRVGEWEQYYLGLDGGAHQASLRSLGIPFSNGVTADDPRRFVTLDDLAAVMIRYSDNAATDFLRYRLGEGLINATAARWPTLQVPEILAEVLHFVLGRRVSVRQYLRDPRLQLEVIGKFPDIPTTYEGQRPWARGTWSGTAAALNRAHRAMTDVPVARTHLEHGHALPPGVAGIGFKGGSLPGIITVGFSVRWADGRVGSAAVLTKEVDEQRFGTAAELVELTRNALLEPAVLRRFQVTLS
ncbi:serine hydrolase [Saccharothrix deserti]|uniref:serine hydrolase n=1 Tax=Saccharothrix deserti TaxID=2593674 RepID=UPI00131AD3B9|nr:serine hydrolase [Saccharothrix deserti]